MIPIGFFHEMELYADNGKVKDHIVEVVDYDKDRVIEYMDAQKRYASCPKAVIDLITGEEIAQSFSVYTDGEYEWCDFLPYYIKKYNIMLPQSFLDKIDTVEL